MKSARAGILGRSRKASLVLTRSAPGNFKGTGMAPAAISTRRPVNRSSPTTSVVGPTKRATPWKSSMPISVHVRSVCSVVPPISSRLKAMSRGHSSVRPSAGTPRPVRSRAALTASAAPTRIFLGTQPRRAHVPPNGCRSTTATLQPASRQRDATAEVTPLPTTTRSYCLSMALHPRRAPGRLPPQRLQHVAVVEDALGLDLQRGGDRLEHAHGLDDPGHAVPADERVGRKSLARVLEGLRVELRVASEVLR